MNLIALFNKNYFIENVKKSKSSIVFLALLMPLFTVITILSLSNNYSIITFSQLSVFNIISMYIIPIALSLSLFSYCFKKNQCDFIGSMPISRKSIFITNTIGGIAILALIQIITAILLFFLSIILENVIIYSSMIWDSLLFFTAGYIFVFVCSNLAISFSGNMFSAIASTLIIIFLIPFIIFSSRVNLLFNSEIENIEITNNETISYYSNMSYTIPSYILFDSFTEAPEYNSYSLIKTIIISIIYIPIGVFLFNKKKYEMAEESFENNIIHFIIKLLTLSPFMLIAKNIDIDSYAFVFFVAFIGVYYFIFDLITNKKIKFKISLPIFIVSFVFMYSIFAFVLPKINMPFKKSIKISDIKKVDIVEISESYSDLYNFGLTIDDKDSIYELLTNNDENVYFGWGRTYSKTLRLTLHMQNQKSINLSVYKGDNFDKIIKKYGNKNMTYNYDAYIPILEGVKLTSENKELIKNSIKKDLENLTYYDYYKYLLNNNSNLYNLKLYNYKNHKLEEKGFFSTNFKNTTKECIRLNNQEAYKKISSYEYWYLRDDEDIVEMFEKYNNGLLDNIQINNYSKRADKEITYDEDIYLEKDYYDLVYNCLNLVSKEDMKEFFKSNKDDEVDLNKKYISINSYGSQISFVTNKIEDFYNLLVKSYNKTEKIYTSGIELNEIK